MHNQHTPGPWTVRRMGRSEGEVFVEGQSYEGHPYHGKTRGGIEIMADDNYPTKEADAQLIAAAPDLLEALKLVAESGPLNNGMRDENTLEIVRAAIAKAAL